MLWLHYWLGRVAHTEGVARLGCFLTLTVLLFECRYHDYYVTHGHCPLNAQLYWNFFLSFFFFFFLFLFSFFFFLFFLSFYVMGLGDKGKLSDLFLIQWTLWERDDGG